MLAVKYVCPKCGYEAELPGLCPKCGATMVASCPACGNPVVGEFINIEG